MEKLNVMEKNRLVHELIQGRELANKLKRGLDPIVSNETHEKLVRKILSSYDKALEVLSMTTVSPENSSIAGAIESPCSFDVGACSENKDQFPKDVFKKRKTSPKWSEQVKVCLGTGVEGPMDDGYSWRKYGQKEILGATHPRAYYRCSHKHSKGCNATKQVQKSDEDSSILEITYKGKHTCIQASQSTPPLVSLESGKANENRENIHFGEGLTVKTEGVNDNPTSPFSFPSTPIESENLAIQFFSEPLTESISLGSYSPSFISSETSESNFFEASSSCQMNDLELGMDWGDLLDIISSPSSITNSTFQDFDFSVDQLIVDPNITLSHPEDFS